MPANTLYKKVSDFFLTKIIVGLIVVGGAVTITEWIGRYLLAKTELTEIFKNGIMALLDSAIALISYYLLFSFYEKRRIFELSFSGFWINVSLGLFSGLFLQSFFILVLYLAGDYTIIRVNPFSSLLPSLITAFTAGFVAEILIRGIFFRLVEEKIGTSYSLISIWIIFAVLHAGNPHASFLSISATAMEAGLLLSAAYVFCRNLWFPVFLHFAWDFAEPGIFGAVNPGNSIPESILTSQLNGPSWLTGGAMGPQNSIQSLLLCAITGFVFLWLAKRKTHFKKPAWKNK